MTEIAIVGGGIGGLAAAAWIYAHAPGSEPLSA
jgi:hypothetical protein